jgi:3-oxoacyl-[acyl-carrier protein] reductase
MKHILVTGASGGIGAAIATLLAARGARLTLQYHADSAAAETLRSSLPGSGHQLVQADLANPEAIDRLWQTAMTLQPVEGLVNNAGIFPNHPPLSTAYPQWLQAWRQTLAVNLEGAAHLSYFAARDMAPRGGGRIVNISSRAAFRGELTAPAYAASKAGLNAFSQSMAKALAGQRVLVFVVAPGWVATARVAQAVADPGVLADQPLGRVATPEEVAQVTAFCLLDAPATMTGTIIDVNGASYLRS